MITVFVLFAAGLILIGFIQKVWSDEVYREKKSREYEEMYIKEQNERIEQNMKGVRIIDEE